MLGVGAANSAGNGFDVGAGAGTVAVGFSCICGGVGVGFGVPRRQATAIIVDVWKKFNDKSFTR